MQIKDIPVPEVYKEESMDFRFFLKWFDYALTKTQYDITNFMDLYDPLRCPEELLWMLGDTMGYKYDDREGLCAAFNRFAMLYFMSMIRYKGSKTGVTIAAEVNLKQKDINAYGEENPINYNRLEDTSIPANAVYVESNVEEGCINVVYFTDETPIDSCIEYVRPLGMYCFQEAGVRIDSLTRISVDARLAKSGEIVSSVGATRVGRYSRNDYARLQKMANEPEQSINWEDNRKPAWNNSSTVPEGGQPTANAGYRALSSLQLSNNEHLVKSLFSQPIFSLGEGPITDEMTEPDTADPRYKYNLRYNRSVDMQTQVSAGTDPDYLPVDTLNTKKPQHYNAPNPKVNDIMEHKPNNTLATLGDNLSGN